MRQGRTGVRPLYPVMLGGAGTPGHCSPTGCQAGSTNRSVEEIRDVPFINHMTSCPSDARRHKISDLPSPLKYPVPLAVQSGAANRSTAEVKDVPFINHISSSPSDARRHKMSVLPSPFKSLFVDCRGGGVAPASD